jgi:heptosyltransferase-2
MRKETVTKILVRVVNHLGDSFLMLPAFRALRKAFPDARITILVVDWLAPFWEVVEGADEVVSFPAKSRLALFRLSSSLRSRGYELGAVFPNSFSSALSVFLAGAPVRLGYARYLRRPLLTHPVLCTKEILSVHETLYHLNILSPLGIGREKPDISIKAPGLESERFAEEHGKGPFIGLNTSSRGTPVKDWPVERFTSLAKRLCAAFPGYRLVLFGKGARGAEASRLFRETGIDFLDLYGKTTLRELFAAIAACGLFVTGDTGAMHAAAALGTPLVAVFGSTNPATTGPLADRAVIVRAEMDCSPCVEKECDRDAECMKRVTVDDVFEACRTLLSAPRTAQGVS